MLREIKRGSIWRMRSAPYALRYVRGVGKHVVMVSESPHRGGAWMPRQLFLMAYERA